MNKKLLVAVLALSGLFPALGQSTPTPITDTKTTEPELTAVEKLALGSLQKEFEELQKIQNKANADFADFQKEISIAHPGYIFSPSKGLVKEEKEVKPEAKKVIK